MFWPEEDDEPEVLPYTTEDSATFTHMLYLNVAPEVIVQHRSSDKERSRPTVSVDHMRKWQQAEMSQLRKTCRDRGTLFGLISPYLTSRNKLLKLLQGFQDRKLPHYLTHASRALDEIIVANHGQTETMLFLDADETLAAEDSCFLFWRQMADEQEEPPLKTRLNSSLDTSINQFNQAALLYEEYAADQEFDAFCEVVASKISIHPEFISLLHLIAEQERVGAVVISCGLRLVWEKVLDREGLSKTVKVIGGGLLAESNPRAGLLKDALVGRLRDVYKMYVWAFGDDAMDLAMLREADQGIIVVGELETRRTSINYALDAITGNGSHYPRQTLLPSSVPPRLDATKVPVVDLTSPDFVNAVLLPRRGIQPRHQGPRLHHSTSSAAAQILATPTDNATLSGPVLQAAHRRIGHYLALAHVGSVVGTEEYPIVHDQGNTRTGHHLRHERRTLVVALMRGGEPMAFGINDIFPLASFLHSSQPADVTRMHLDRQITVILIDSVINSGKTVVEFVEHVRKLHASIRIVVVAGVIQAQAVAADSAFAKALGKQNMGDVVALRVSENKFTGIRATDTGNRLFNTTHLD